uniref:Uncharacterized protein n=1 Tax=viral metagenome TaxID=1070528 RepID=A0A6C0I7J9_9ZZZZ
MSDDYVKVLDNKVNKNLTLSKANKLIGTVADYPVNFQTSIRGNWDVVKVLGPDLEVEKPYKFQSSSLQYPNMYLSQYQTKK